MAAAKLGGMRILVVEDEPLIAMELTQTIEEAGGIVVASARSQHEALDHAEHGDFHAALLDVRLPDGSAFEVAARLAARGIPFLFCTADSAGHAKFAGWPDVPVITKPHSPETIVTALSGLLKIRS
ncbi:MAG: response regulator [Hyphomicrobiales bacterium]